MPHSTTSHDELAVASALLNFGTTASTQEKVVATSSNASVSASTTASTTTGGVPPNGEDDSKSAAVVTVVSQASNASEDVPSGKETDTKKRQAEPLLTLAPAPVKATKRQRTEPKGKNASPEIIQDCHAVLGDRHCAGRTTIATVILREIKHKYKENYKGKGVDNWYEEAMAEYYQRVKEKVPGFSKEDYQTVLVYSYTPKGRKEKGRNKAADEVGASRIEKPNCYKYHTDDFPKYGMAKVPEAVKFFFNSKDAPTLPKEISKYRSDFEKLKSGNTKPPHEKMTFFEDFLKFCEDNLQKAKDEEMAQQLLHSLNLIPTLRRLWDTLKASTAVVPSSSLKHPKTTVAQAVLKATAPPAPATAPTTTTSQAPQTIPAQIVE